jgi:branched-chain amino acid transport system substrate-binding protein
MNPCLSFARRAAVMAVAALSAGLAQAELRVGFLGPMTGPLGITGQEMKRGFDLALEHLEGRIGGQPTQVSYGNDQGNPGVAIAEVSRLIDKDRIHAVVGFSASNVVMAVAQPVTKAGVMLLSAHAGPSVLAGRGCNENLFFVGHQNDQHGIGMGEYLKKAGVKSLYTMGLDFQGGWDIIDATVKAWGGTVAGKTLTPLPQVDFAPELALVRSAKPDGLFVFYPGAAAVSFVRQFAGTGMHKHVQLYAVGAVVDSLVLPAQGNAALGVITSNSWNATLPNAENKRFVADFQARHKRAPTSFSAQAYDTVMYLDAAVRQMKAPIEGKALREALRRNPAFKSIRGKFRLNSNHFPVLDMVIERVEKDDSGNPFHKVISTIADVGDPYAAQCPMKW